MSFEVLNYNNVPMSIIHTKQISRHHVMSEDNTTYLWTKWLFDVRTAINDHTVGLLFNALKTWLAQQNPNSIAGLTPNPSIDFPGVPIDTLSGISPALMDVLLRQLLNVPRKALIFSQSQDNSIYNVVLNVPNNPQNFADLRNQSVLSGMQSDPAGVNAPAGVKFLTDCQNGPIVEDFDLVRDHAGKTWIVVIRLSTCVRECPFSQSQDPTHGSGSGQSSSNPIISNRWTRRMSTTGEKGGYLSFVETQGEAVFDSAWLLALGRADTQNTPGVVRWATPGAGGAAGRFPDQYRFDLFQPIAPNCQREDVSVEQASDGVTYRYSFRDQERHFNTLPACYLEAYVTRGFNQMGFESAVVGAGLAQVGQVSADIQAAISASAGSTLGSGLLGSAAGSVSAVAKGAMMTGLTCIQRQIPKYTTHILVRAWGTRDTPKSILLMQCSAIAMANLDTLRSVDMVITEEMTGKYVEFQITNTTGPEEIFGLLQQQFSTVMGAAKTFIEEALKGNVNLTLLAGNDSALSQNTYLLINQMINRQEADAGGWFDQDEARVQRSFQARRTTQAGFRQFFPGTLTTTPAGTMGSFHGNAQPPHDNYTRGSMICNLIAQALHSPCQPPPCPPKVYPADLPAANQNSAYQFDPVRTCGETAAVPTNPPVTPPPTDTPSPAGTGTLQQAVSGGQPTPTPPFMDPVSTP